MKILLSIDDSPYSEAASEFVRKMSWPAGTRVIVVSSVTMPTLAYSETYVPAIAQIDVWLQEMTKIHQELVSRVEQKLKDAGLGLVESRVLQGDPRESLLELAATEHPDLIVVGSHGRTGLTKLVLGSVASHVVTHAPCSVLVVRKR